MEKHDIWLWIYRTNGFVCLGDLFQRSHSCTHDHRKFEVCDVLDQWDIV